MSVTARFLADWTSFYEAVDKADVKLVGFQDSAHGAESALNRMVDNFSGRKVTQQATLVTEAIERIGGTSKLSTNEAASALQTLEAGMDKLLRTGEQIPTSMMKQAAELRRVGIATEAADAAVHKITSTYRQYDGILQSVGINIGPYVKGLEDVTALATGGAVGMGALATALSAVAVGFGAIKVGQFIGEETGWTDAIAKGTAALLGWGDAAQQRALAIADSLDLAGKAEANQKRATEAANAHAKAIKDESDTIKENWRITDGNKDAMARLADQLAANEEKRKKDAIATFQASQAQSIFGEETEKATTKIEQQTIALDLREDSLKRIADEAVAAQKQIDDFMQAATLSDRQAASASSDIPSLVGTALDQAIIEGHRAGDRGGDAQALQRRLSELESKEGRYQIHNNADFFAMQKDQVLLAQLRELQESGKIPGFADGVENFPGGLAYVHKDEALVNMPSGTSVIPAQRAGGGFSGATFHLTINANSRMDGQRAGKAFIDYVKSTGQILPA